MDLMRERIVPMSISRGVPADPGPVRGVIHVGGGNALCPEQDLFIQPDAGRAPDAVDDHVRLDLVSRGTQSVKESRNVYCLVFRRAGRPLTPLRVEIIEAFICE